MEKRLAADAQETGNTHCVDFAVSSIMPTATKNWCVHPSHDGVDAQTGKQLYVKSGRSPTYPLGIHRVDAAIAASINEDHAASSGKKSKCVLVGEKICTTCFRKERKKNDGRMAAMEDGSMDIDEDEQSTALRINEGCSDSPSSQEMWHARKEATDALNAVFKLFNIPAIYDQ